MKILIADDEYVARLCLKNSLKSLGYEVIEAADGDQAWQMINEFKPDLALIDWMMPGIDGVDLCKMVRQQSDLPYIYIIMVTGKSDNSDVVYALESGADDFVTKPSPANILRSRVAVGLRMVQYERRLKEKNILLEKYNREMEDIIQQRTSQLVHSERVATVGLLSAGIAHEINNPMTFISGNIQMLGKIWQDLQPLLEENIQQGQGDKSKIEFVIDNFSQILDDMGNGVKRVTKITNGLKAFCRKEQGKTVPCNLNSCVENALELCSNALKYNVEVIKDLDASINEVLADAQQIEQVLVNLFINASDAIAEQGQGTLEIKTCQNNENVQISIGDSGSGIPTDKLGNIWKPFFTTKAVDKGTGLGLPIALGIIESHKGRIKAENKPQGGALFTIEIPKIRRG